MPVWKRINKPESGFLDGLSDSIALLESHNPKVLAPVDEAPMWLVSDYSGQHKGAAFEAYSFLVTTERDISAWDTRRRACREEFLSDGRRLSFKKLKEPVRWRALLPFLNVADELHGNLLTFVIDKRLPSLFKEQGVPEWSDLPRLFPPGTSTNTIEKSLRLGMFLSLLLAGLRKELQHAIWISDQDDVLEDYPRRERFAEFVSYVSLAIANWTNPAPLHFYTTAIDSDDRFLEDLTAIADLAAGALANLAPSISTPEDKGISMRMLRRGSCTDVRTQTVVDWLARRDRPLKRMLLRVVLDATGAKRARAETIGLFHHLPALPQRS